MQFMAKLVAAVFKSLGVTLTKKNAPVVSDRPNGSKVIAAYEGISG